MFVEISRRIQIQIQIEMQMQIQVYRARRTKQMSFNKLELWAAGRKRAAQSWDLECGKEDWGCAFPCLIDFAASAASVTDSQAKAKAATATRKTNAASLPPTLDASLMKLPKRRYDDSDAVLRSGCSIFLVAASR